MRKIGVNYIGLFVKKEIIKVEILSHIEGISEQDALMNYAVGHMIGGFDGMVHADLLNKSQVPMTVFLVTYSNGKTKKFKVKNDSLLYFILIDKVI